jgi:hypothetical protein
MTLKVHLKMDIAEVLIDEAWRRWRSYRKWIRVNPELWNRSRFNTVFFNFYLIKALEKELQQLKLAIFENEFEFQFYSKFGFANSPIAGRNKELYDEIKRSIYNRLKKIADDCDQMEFTR